jgi:opacity protein-like surface antigen
MTRWITFALIALAAPFAFAQDYSREGFSVGGSLSAAFEDFDDGSFDDTFALGLFAGYRFHPNFGIDVRLEQTDEFDGDVGPFDVDVEIGTLTVNGQFFLLTDQFQPYLIGGLGIGEAEVDVDPGGSDDETDPVVRLGAGFDVYATPHFVIGGEAAYNIGIDDIDDFDYWTLSALFRYRF